MTKAASESAVERWRSQMEPQGYIAAMQRDLTNYETNASNLVADYDVIQADPNINDEAREIASKRIEEQLKIVLGRIEWFRGKIEGVTHPNGENGHKPNRVTRRAKKD